MTKPSEIEELAVEFPVVAITLEDYLLDVMEGNDTVREGACMVLLALAKLLNAARLRERVTEARALLMVSILHCRTNPMAVQKIRDIRKAQMTSARGTPASFNKALGDEVAFAMDRLAEAELAAMSEPPSP
jgi:hypothetical protein